MISAMHTGNGLKNIWFSIAGKPVLNGWLARGQSEYSARLRALQRRLARSSLIVLALVIALLPAVAMAENAKSQSLILGDQGGAGNDETKQHEFRDCKDCPIMVETPGGLVIGKYSITRGEYRVFAKATKLESNGCILRIGTDRQMVDKANWLNPGFKQTDDHPVVCVSWVEATAYADWLSERTKKQYRLLTFEESAAAAAAGTKTVYWWGDSFDDACRYANIGDKQFQRAFPADTQDKRDCDDGYAYTSPVTKFPANPWGLHDMAGNVWNWTNSCLKGDCANAIFRGGGWDVPWPNLFERDSSFGDRIVLRNDVIGFRLLREN